MSASHHDIFVSYARGCGLDPGRSRAVASAFLARLEEPPAPECMAGLLVSFTAACGVRPGRAIYVSTPLTTGRGHREWRARNGDGPITDAAVAALRDQALTDNRRVARELAEKVRSLRSTVVIDPSWLLDVPGWGQRDYHDLWIRVIESYVATVVFVDDWHHSVGCALEFAAAVRLGLGTLTQRLDRLDYAEGVRLVREAVHDLETSHVDAVRLKEALVTAEDALAGVSSRS